MISRKPVTMSARPPTVTSFIKKKEPSKPAAAASEQKPQKSVSGAISQYRVRVESAEERRPSHILNTTLDLLDDSDTELPTEPEIRMESLVINLCERLEEMETPSSCKSRGDADAEVKVEDA
ncbi:hypothetical protein PHYPO_G00076500 [Pangasianodon hypophthalmus]|uniref:Uncharacterized protein n=1 Tax=Pangasianodon hypophthalmus TaxID=310915 RepID=A0A5N5LKZ1_PANHP|nr:hypothetical protein PHYPO_G00076500 [Pangasianodon hypophthalmus]